METFEPLGIVAYTMCCRLGCTGNYGDGGYECRPAGIVFIRLALDGMNYRERPSAAYAYYREYEFLMNNWDGEKAILDRWCSIVGLPRDGYAIHKPEHGRTIEIKFKEPLELEIE